jgi:hypothetical protein
MFQIRSHFLPRASLRLDPPTYKLFTSSHVAG